MSRFKNDIIEAAEGEAIEAVVIGEMGWGGDYGSEKITDYEKQPRGVVLSWADAAPILDYEYNTGYGSPECNAVYVWTTERVLFVTQYDGSTCISSVPRHPVNVVPEMPGG